MMKAILMILYMIVIGAAIGALTNHLAIKMLFRPHKPVYIGEWRVPFTPGLIPKRRDELAVQLGLLVSKHLLTAESIQKKILTVHFQKEMTYFVQKELERLLGSDEKVGVMLKKLGLPHDKEKLDHQLLSMIKTRFTALLDTYRDRPIRAFLSEALLEKLDSKLPVISAYILKKGEDFFSSEEGKRKIAVMIDDFARQRSGMMGNMLKLVLANVNLTDKIQQEILKFLKNEGTIDLVTAILRTEWEKILNWEAGMIEEQIGREQMLSLVEKYSLRLIQTERLLQTKASSLFASFKDEIIERIAPEAVRLLSFWFSEKIVDILGRLRLEDLIREQVESFSVQRLEEMVLLITKREFKMITYLGGVLGGLIGFFQGLLVLFFG